MSQPLQRRLLLSLAVAAWLGLAAAPPARAAGVDSADVSLKEVPADAAYYVAILRGKEQYDAIAKSKAVAQLMKLPAFKQAVESFHDGLNQNGGAEQFNKWYEQEENKKLVEFFGDLVANEVFFYAGNSLIELNETFVEMSRASQRAQLAKLNGKDADVDDSTLQARAMLRYLAAHPERIKAPEFVIGFKVSDAKRAQEQLKQLDTLLHLLAMQQPDLKDALKREKVDGVEYLTLSATGKLLPWDQIPLKDFEEKPGEFAKVIEKLQDTKLTVSVACAATTCCSASATRPPTWRSRPRASSSSTCRSSSRWPSTPTRS